MAPLEEGMGIMKRIAVVLSGCGFLDGSEITEAISTLIHLSDNNVEYKCFAPNKSYPQKNHLSKNEEGKVNALEASARISRGEIYPLSTLSENNFDGIIFPGGYGAASNLSNWASKGSQSQVDEDVSKIIKAFYLASKPIGAICIAPTLIAKVLGTHGVTVTLGNDPENAKEIEKTGAIHETCKVTDFISDREHKVITTPAYMYEAKPHEVFQGIGKLVKELVEMA